MIIALALILYLLVGCVGAVVAVRVRFIPAELEDISKFVWL